MVFLGDGDISGQMGAIATSGYWGLILLTSLLMMNLITFIFNLIPLPPLDGWKIVSKTYRQLHHKPVNEKLETALTIIGLIIIFWIFVSGIICDFIN
jgi:regulator of sigma E protease